MQDIEGIMKLKIRDMIELVAGFTKKDWKFFQEAMKDKIATYEKGKKSLDFFERIMAAYQNTIQKVL